jgi:hypothetical protein
MGGRIMNNTDLILAFLKKDPLEKYCDDCISDELNIKPRQQVNARARELAVNQLITRKTDICSSCYKEKLSNSFNELSKSSLSISHSNVRDQTVPYDYQVKKQSLKLDRIDIEHERNRIVQICREIWIKNKKDKLPHSISFIINTLRGEQIPNHQANMMLTLCSLRNVFVYENYPLGKREIEIAENAIEIIKDWWEKTANSS